MMDFPKLDLNSFETVKGSNRIDCSAKLGRTRVLYYVYNNTPRGLML